MNAAEANARFSELVARGEAGKTVEVLRRGKPVARLEPVERPKRMIDAAAIRQRRTRFADCDREHDSIVVRVRREAQLTLYLHASVAAALIAPEPASERIVYSRATGDVARTKISSFPRRRKPSNRKARGSAPTLLRGFVSDWVPPSRE